MYYCHDWWITLGVECLSEEFSYCHNCIISEFIIIVGEIHSVETIAVGHGIREFAQLRNRYGNWQKKKGVRR